MRLTSKQQSVLCAVYWGELPPRRTSWRARFKLEELDFLYFDDSTLSYRLTRAGAAHVESLSWYRAWRSEGDIARGKPRGTLGEGYRNLFRAITLEGYYARYAEIFEAEASTRVQWAKREGYALPTKRARKADAAGDFALITEHPPCTRLARKEA